MNDCSIRNYFTPSLLPIYPSSVSPYSPTPLFPPPSFTPFSFLEAQIVHLELKKGIVLHVCIKCPMAE